MICGLLDKGNQQSYRRKKSTGTILCMLSIQKNNAHVWQHFVSCLSWTNQLCSERQNEVWWSLFHQALQQLMNGVQCVMSQPPLSVVFRNVWPHIGGANSERSRRNPVPNPSFMICSDVVGLRCLGSRTFSLSVRPCCYICSSFSPDCVSRCPQWIKHETNPACRAMITFFFLLYQPLNSVYIKVNSLLGNTSYIKEKSNFIYY